jgi:hypothetical protein
MGERDPVDVRVIEHRGKTYCVAIYLMGDEVAERTLYEVARRAINARREEVTFGGGLFTLTIQEVRKP